MGQVLYRKYRSKTLDEIVGQEHITTTLKRALAKGAISHAYLFTGPRGVGKTSIARILAHELNNLPYDGEDMHLDIIEIDAASNRGIDEIRALRDKVNIAPASGKYKVYIIDEVHMLTTPAFNALLKTLEEPPAHVVFILATTEAHKLPATIVSRTQRYSFRPVETAKVVKHLRHIADQEQLVVDDAALALIAEHGEGSFRDSISLLNQAAGSGEAVNAATIYELVGLPPAESITQLLSLVSAGNKSDVMQQLHALYDQGYSAAAIAKLLGRLAQQAVVTGALPSGIDEAKLLELLGRLLGVSASSEPNRLLEIVLLQAMPKVATSQQAVASAATVAIARELVEPATPLPQSIKPVTPIVNRKSAATVTEPTAEPEPVPQPAAKKPPTTTGASTELTACWPAVLQTIKQTHNTVYGILRMAEPDFATPEELTLRFRYAFHQKRMQEPKHKKIISDTVTQITGHSVRITCQFDASATPAKPIVSAVQPPATATPAPLAAISNIFGGGELLES